jgi:lipoprotein-releasing system permease protein
VIVLAVMTGFGDMWREKILSFKPHLVVDHASGYIDEVETACETIEKVDARITAVCPAIQTPVMVRHADQIQTPVVIGLDPERAEMFARVRKRTRGRFDISGRNCVMGADLAYSLRIVRQSEVLIYSPMNLISPDELYLPEELNVAGVFDMGMRDYDSVFILTSLDVARDLIGKFEGAQSIQIQVENPEQVQDVAAKLRTALGDNYRIQTWQEVDSVLFGALRTEKTMMFVLLVFIAIVAVFCVTNTLIVITVQKTHEIGLLKALGFSSRQLMGAFLLHGQVQCLAGTSFGVLTGWVVLRNLNGIVRFLTRWNVEVFPKEIYFFAEIPWKIIPGDVALTVASVYVFCAVASLIPAWRAARMDPVEALRQE